MFIELEPKLPVTIARKHFGKYFGDIIAPKTLANYSSLGIGPKQMKIGKNTCYLTKNLLDWLEEKYGE